MFFALKIIEKFSQQQVGVIGDVMLDRYIVGEVERISAEAPTPIVLVRKERFVPGGAANTAANIAALGGAVSLFGAVGRDAAAAHLGDALRSCGISPAHLVASSKPTVEKARVLVSGHQMLRLDREDADYVSRSVEAKVIRAVRLAMPKWGAVVISDYAKGFVTEELAREVVRLARKLGKPIVVDTKPRHFRFYRRVDLITPNMREAEDTIGEKITGSSAVRAAIQTLSRRSGSGILLTQGADGMTLFDGHRVRHLPSAAREVFDVTGAGDTVVATLALGLGSGATLYEASWIANHAAGLVVGKAGTATVSLSELTSFLKGNA